MSSIKCPNCGSLETEVADSRPWDDGTSIKRRRRCKYCEYRFNTFERIESFQIIVIKKDGTSQEFSKEKIKQGVLKSCEKRPVTMAQIENLANEIERYLQDNNKHEVKSVEIGEMVMEKLKDLDDVAYVRFASVYKQFKSMDTFLEELENIVRNKKQPQ